MNARGTALKFVEAINRRDPDAIYGLMTEDHRFVDSMATVHDGRAGMREGWAGYYKMVPDYQIEVTEVFVSGDTVAMLGRAFGTYTSDGEIRPENYWETPAAWKAIVKGDKIKHWQVYADNEPIRAIMRRK